MELLLFPWLRLLNIGSKQTRDGNTGPAEYVSYHTLKSPGEFWFSPFAILMPPMPGCFQIDLGGHKIKEVSVIIHRIFSATPPAKLR
jgi:hypothetical protein